MVVVLIAYWHSALRLAIRPWAIAVGFLALSVSVDLLIWPHYMLSDTMYKALAMLAVYAAIGVIQSAGPSQGASTGGVYHLVKVVLFFALWVLTFNGQPTVLTSVDFRTCTEPMLALAFGLPGHNG